QAGILPFATRKTRQTDEFFILSTGSYPSVGGREFPACVTQSGRNPPLRNKKNSSNRRVFYFDSGFISAGWRMGVPSLRDAVRQGSSPSQQEKLVKPTSFLFYQRVHIRRLADGSSPPA